MIGTSERRTVEFLNWEARGRGYAVWPHPVTPEPLFAPFTGAPPHGEQRIVDDGRKETFLGAVVRKLSERLAPPARQEEAHDGSERTPPILTRERLIELVAHLPPNLPFDAADYARLFTSLSVCAEPVAFEILATDERISVQFVVSPRDERLARRQLEAHLPSVGFVPMPSVLDTAWGDAGERYVAAVEFGLGREFMIPLVPAGADPFIGLVGALSEIEAGEIALFQVIFTPARFPWHESIMRSVAHADGSAMFINAPELLVGAREKTREPLFAAVVRVATRSPNCDRSWEIACNVAGALGAYGSPHGNELVPLTNDGYPSREHEFDLLARQSRRSGMLLTASELAGFAHLPSDDVRSPRLRRLVETTKAAPALVQRASGLRLGTNEHLGIGAEVALSDEIRLRHLYVIGATGTGKSSLLYNLITEDMENGYGCSVLDPHGDLIDRLLGSIPEHRLGDVILLDPTDPDFVIPFTILSAHSDWERNLLAADLVSVFRRLSTAWGDQLNSVLGNALLAVLESDRGGTLFDVRRFLLEAGFRAELLKSVRDADLVYYWQRVFPALSGNKSVGPVVTRLDTFLAPKALRYMVGERENRIDFADILDSGKIFLAKLPEGFIGKENAHLLGSFLVSKLQTAAMARQRESESTRRIHTLYADEFQNYLTPSLAECLTGVRKYGLGLVLAHQELRQVEREPDVLGALLNAGTRIIFRVGDRDARTLENGFTSFSARDIQNLETGRAICRVERSDWDFNLAIEHPRYPDLVSAQKRRALVVAANRKKYAVARERIERAHAAAVLVETATEAPRAKETDGEAKKATLPESALVPVPTAPVLPVAPAPAGVTEKTEPKPAIIPPALGKGGAQHKAVQERLKEAAEKLGFRVVVEEEFPGLGQIDLVLKRDGVSVACEVTVEQTIDYEVGNVSKCRKAGFTRIAVVGVSEDRLSKLESAVANSLGAEKARCVGYFLPDAFIDALRVERKPQPVPEPVARTRGVKRKIVEISAGEMKEKEDQAMKLMAQLMRQRKKTS